MVAPTSLRSALRAARQADRRSQSDGAQASLARFIDEGLLARHVRKAAGAYAARYGAVVGALGDVPGGRLVPSRPVSTSAGRCGAVVSFVSVVVLSLLNGTHALWTVVVALLAVAYET